MTCLVDIHTGLTIMTFITMFILSLYEDVFFNVFMRTSEHIMNETFHSVLDVLGSLS